MLLFTAVIVAASCGASDDDPGGGSTTTTAAPGPDLTVAPMRFDGRLTLVELILDGRPIALENRPSLIIDAEFGGLEVRPGCNTRYGSFTLTADGAASFTVPGGTSTDCAALASQEAAIEAALRRIDGWTATDDGVLFTGRDLSLRTTGPTPVEADDGV